MMPELFAEAITIIIIIIFRISLTANLWNLFASRPCDAFISCFKADLMMPESFAEANLLLIFCCCC
jgi:hypothetical protein